MTADDDDGAEDDSGQDEPPVDLAAMLDLTTPWCLRVVATLRIPQHLAAGLTHVDDLAKAAGCDATALDQVLGHLVGKRVFRRPAPGRYVLDDAGRQLLDPALFLDLDGLGGRLAHAWATLPDYVRTGRPAYAERFGLPWWQDLEAHPRLAAEFDALMGAVGHGPPDPGIELTDGWAAVGSVVDVGGGDGSMLVALLHRHPHLHATLVDLPGTVARAHPVFAAAGVAGRVTTSGQSFFDPLPAGADLYLLRKVLNDWPDDDKVAILRRCAAAARPTGGRVVVLGGVAPEHAPPQVTVEMVLVGGRVATLTEFAALAARADLHVVAATTQSCGYIVECRPSAPAGGA